jgi:hypothetical protein
MGGGSQNLNGKLTSFESHHAPNKGPVDAMEEWMALNIVRSMV